MFWNKKSDEFNEEDGNPMVLMVWICFFSLVECILIILIAWQCALSFIQVQEDVKQIREHVVPQEVVQIDKGN